MSIVRAEVIAQMRKAFRKGQSATSFIWEMRQKGLGYRHTTMLSDCRAESGQEVKEGLLRFVRKDRYPAKTAIADKPYRLSKEFMYKVKVESRLRPDVVITERFVNLMSDVPMTPDMIEQAITEKWSEYEDYTAEAIEKIIPFTAIHRTLE